MRALLVLATLALAAPSARADRAADPPLPFATACADEFNAAATIVGRKHRAFRGVTSFASPARHSLARWSLQQRSPEHFYADAIDVRDDDGDWASIVRAQGVWSCRQQIRGKQHNLDCVLQRGQHLAILRVIHWKRTPRVDAFFTAFKAGAEACFARSE